MKKNSQKKLAIYRETIQRIDTQKLHQVDGAFAVINCTSTAGPPCEVAPAEV